MPHFQLSDIQHTCRYGRNVKLHLSDCAELSNRSAKWHCFESRNVLAELTLNTHLNRL